MKALQTSKLLPSLFEHLEPERRVTVLDVGPALPETVDFFSAFRCRLYFVDLFAELPLSLGEEETDYAGRLEQSLNLPSDAQLDLCLFWDIFNYLPGEAITAFMQVLRPHLHRHTRAHAFAMHKLKSPQGRQYYGVSGRDSVLVGQRPQPLPGYAPRGQGPLKTLLGGFEFERSVLLGDGRLELLLGIPRAGAPGRSQ